MLEVIAVITALVVGLALGWWMRGNDPRFVRLRARSDDAARAREALDRLRELTRNVAEDVDKHKALMGQINDELNASDAQEPTAVIEAVGKLIESNEQMQQQLHSAEETLENQAREIVTHAFEARTDALTALANRRAFDTAMTDAYRSSVDQNVPTSVMLIDIDHFKRLNDTYGHQAGDEVLCGIARCLKAELPDDVLIARYGGEEFAVIFQGATARDIDAVAERARKTIGETKFSFDGLQLRTTASAGLAQFQQGDTVASVIARADEALYASKEFGRDCGHAHHGNQILLLGTSRKPTAPAKQVATKPARYDVGISSAEAFSTDLRRRIEEWKNGGAPLCVLFVQIDDLTNIRKQHGPDNCDAALRAVTLTMKAAMREIDHAARFDGEALSLLLPGCTLRGAVSVAERLRMTAARCELPKKFTHRQFTVSIGVAEAIEDEREDQLIDRVRDSLTVARMHGQDCTYVHDGLDFHLIGVGTSSVAI
jgi:diguanylate cyclase